MLHVPCHVSYKLSFQLCVDEQLVVYHGRCLFKVYIPNNLENTGWKFGCVQTLHRSPRSWSRDWSGDKSCPWDDITIFWLGSKMLAFCWQFSHQKVCRISPNMTNDLLWNSAKKSSIYSVFTPKAGKSSQYVRIRKDNHLRFLLSKEEQEHGCNIFLY